MAEEAPDDGQKTEEPTQKRIQDAIDRGEAPRSQDVVALALLVTATIVVAIWSSDGGAAFVRHFQPFLESPHAIPADGGGLARLAMGAAFAVAALIGLPLLALFVAAVVANVAQAPPVFTGEKLKMDLAKLSPIQGLKRLFGFEALVTFAKGLLKVACASAAAVWAVWPDAGALARLMAGDPALVGAASVELLLRMLMAMLAVIAIFAALDYAWQRFSFLRRMRMSRQEMRDELKQTEGDPLVKMKIRQVRLERSRRRMMAAVPEATVVVTNPTHFAVALKYEQGAKRAAPVCVAKGVDALALRIRAVAEGAGVPVVENPPLARALYRGVEIDQEIPVEHYKAVAQIIGFVMKTRARR